MATVEPESRVEGYARAILRVAEAEGDVAGASDELFRFARTLEANEDLRRALSDRTVPVERRLGVVEDLLGRPTLRITTAVVSLLVAADRGSELPQVVDRFVELAAEARDREVAEVRSAVPLDDATQRRLAEALGRATGKRVEVKVVVDERVLGGIVTRIGDTVIDGTVRHRLEQLKETI